MWWLASPPCDRQVFAVPRTKAKARSQGLMARVSQQPKVTKAKARWIRVTSSAATSSVMGTMLVSAGNARAMLR